VILIGNIDWNVLRAEYIGGGTSYRKLARKYGISVNTLSPIATAEGWPKLRQEAQDKATAKTIQKTASIAADNATIAARIRTKLLQKLEKEIDALPDMVGSETRNSVTENEFSKDGRRIQKVKEAAKSFKLRDLAAAYKDLTADMIQTEESGNELLQSLLDLERRAES
jgi:hypothetical protein